VWGIDFELPALGHGSPAQHQNGDGTGLEKYSEKALARVWKA